MLSNFKEDIHPIGTFVIYLGDISETMHVCMKIIFEVIDDLSVCLITFDIL